ncbi:MAG: tRNA pseudouridine synthase A [Deltaproteobacteria bacterium]|nr:tRNA pseudouridine synthase A [Deltaproteobacteria bacterium]
MKRHTYRVELAYDGAAFAGFSPVPNERTVASTFHGALCRLAPGFAKLAAGGRTDRGVSATGQVVSFIYRDPVDTEAIRSAIDAAAPDALIALDVRKVSNSFHAQFSASARRYVYFWPDDGAIDVARVDRSLAALLGRRSFHAFSRNTPRGQSPVRLLTDATARRVEVDGRPFVRFDFSSHGFLRRQLRVLVPTAIRESEIADDEALVRIAESADRRRSALPADPKGLVLTKVLY